MKNLTLYIMVVLLFACTSKPTKNELLVFGAASLKNVLTELADNFESTNEIDVQLNFASTGTLARQIEHGARPGIYIAANEKWVDYLIEADLLNAESKKKVAGNSLVIVVPGNSQIDTLSFGDNFTKAFKGRLSMGDPKHVPAGEYAWQSIEKAGYVGAMNNRILPAKDVRSALMFVELGEAEAGIVYKTDALKSEKVKVVASISENYHSEIGLFSAMLENLDDEQSTLFYNYLSSAEAKNIWLKHGFTIE